MPKTKRKRLVRGRDYDGWALKDKHGQLVRQQTSVIPFLTKEEAEIWADGKAIVRVKLMEVK